MMGSNSTNISLVEGEWKNFLIKRVNPEDYDKVLEHVAEHFVRDEPTCKLLGYSREFAAEFNSALEKILPQGMSFLVEEKDSGELAGVRINFRHSKETHFEDLSIKSPQAQALFRIVAELESQFDVFKSCGVDEYAELFVASTHPKYRNQGIQGEMYARCLKFFKAEGLKYAKVIVTNSYTKSATTKLGFKDVAKVEYDKLLDDEGKSYFPVDQITENDFAVTRIKNLSENLGYDIVEKF